MMSRIRNADLPEPVDLLVIGGGVNGAGIARDAAGRGLSVVLCDKDDLAWGTSSRSGKLVHGGLRYLEYYEFRLVREALIEREVLLNAAPHIIWPMRFVLPHSREQRPVWLIRLGLFLYDHLGGRKKLPATRALNLAREPEGRPIRPAFRKAFEYSDCWADDARLVVANALDAQARGALVFPRTPCIGARRDGAMWVCELADAVTGDRRTLTCRAVVNAAGPWVTDVLNRVAGSNSRRSIRLVKGSHIVTRKFWDGPQAYLLQNTDKRVIFVNPYQDGLALIGTTDIPVEGDPDAVAIDDGEIDYLLGVIDRYFEHAPTRADIVHSFSGVRPLYDDEAENPSAVTRDYVFDVEPKAPEPGRAPMLSVFGGKITTYRKLAEHALDKLAPFFPSLGQAWTAGPPLAGGDLPDADFDRFLADLQADHPWLPAALALHYARLYGTAAHRLLDGAAAAADLGTHFGGLLYAREAAYLRAVEWADTAEDVLERRTKHGLALTEAQRERFTTWFDGAPAALDDADRAASMP